MFFVLKLLRSLNSCLTPASIPSKYYPPLGSPDLSTLTNSLFHFLGDKIGARIVLPSVNKLQKMEGLDPVKRFSQEILLSKHLTLLAASSSLFSRKPDWKKNVHVCGFMNIPTSEDIWDIPPKLQEFIEAAPPIYITFGSSDYFQPEDNLRLCVDAIRLSKQRAIIQTTVDPIPQTINDPNIYIVNKTPHKSIFPLCSAIVHHGGAGTTQSSLLAGRASLVVEHAFDQTYWAQQLNKVGVAEKMLHRRSVTPQKLADGITTILSSPKYNENAQKIGTMLRKENGVKKAVQLIEERFLSCYGQRQLHYPRNDNYISPFENCSVKV